ncbi:prephenate dehydrogenase [Polluticaenibacter yanchengensis]|uniref:Prephenate dehydrogenase n=1 Tax=Polluticaenibacter yanchengensis TaxID=3014562 RepID=A0ABT4UPL0_9BACT|nr:prephenate dehydrogenase [Chitinophagaceae bacterium LY-5]
MDNGIINNLNNPLTQLKNSSILNEALLKSAQQNNTTEEKETLTLAIVGVGLIGGSFALSLRDKQIVSKVIGVANSEKSAQRALELGIVDEVLPLEAAVKAADIIYVAIPVDATIPVIQNILNILSSKQILIDAGSTKNALCLAVSNHPKRNRFVATHPMWGTEYSGPDAAVKNGFTGRSCVICEKERSDPDALRLVENLYTTLGMHITYMQPYNHDIHAAYVSHISHITSFALANTVLEKELEDDTIFTLAGGGFESTVRLAKSSADMWIPIFEQNKENVLDVLNEHITQLRKFKSCFEKENWQYLRELIENANGIKRILK